MRHAKIKRFLIIVIVLIFLILWTYMITKFGPSKIVDYFGFQNSYIIIFFSAVIGGSTILTAIPFYTTYATFAAGGLNVFILGLLGGIGITITDFLFYYLAKKGRVLIFSTKANQKIAAFRNFLNKNSKKWTAILIFCYAVFVPLPNDLMTITLGLSDYSSKKIIIPLLLGNITYMTLFAYLAKIGISLFFV